MSAVTSIKNILQQKLHSSSIELNAVSGGSINETYKILADKKSFFCKINSATKFPHLFEKEVEGVNLLKQKQIIKVPEVVDSFIEDDKQFLILDWIDSGVKTINFWKSFGEQLAALHHTTNEYYGLDHDNYMGSVEQKNTASDDWIDFFIEQRLEPLLKKCIDKNLLCKQDQDDFKILYTKLPEIFNVGEKPSLLHGDLWSGNYMCDKKEQPVLIDPAVYFGHRSVDLGMTTLFGGFHDPFYEAYHYHFPFPNNYEEQWKVCNLYPLLIHLFLFGSSYLSQIREILFRYR